MKYFKYTGKRMLAAALAAAAILLITGAESKAADIAVIYPDIYEEAVHTNATGSLEMMRDIVSKLGEAGYTAVDCENQADMVRPEPVMQFGEAAKAGKKEETVIIVPDNKGGLVRYELKTEDGKVDIVRQYYQYAGGKMEKRSTASYQAKEWRYTEDGYLLFGGSYHTVESYVLVMSDEAEYVALRVAPLDETCREMNRKYILPAGYRQNNLFLTDWSEEDFADVSFYDIFEVFYALSNGRENPYVMDRNPNTGIVYHVPEKEFENVIMSYFRTDVEKLRARTGYLSCEKAYEYRPRGFYELGYSNIPYPEVVSYEEKKDGTIELTVNAVFPYEYTSKAYSHKVVVRPLEDGGFQYVSNRILPPGYYDIWWYPERLTEEAWEAAYGEGVLKKHGGA